MKKIVLLFVGMTALNAPAFADDNVANCEVVVEKIGNPIEVIEGEPAVMVFDFVPADKFIFSVFKPEAEPISRIDGNVIRGLMCTRTSVLPTEFDMKLIRTGVPFYLSQNFDAPDSSLMAINGNQDGYTYTYNGPDLSGEDQDVLDLRMKSLNAEQKKLPEEKIEEETLEQEEIKEEKAEE